MTRALYIIAGIITLAAYVPARAIMIRETAQDTVVISSLTVNLILGFAIAGIAGGEIARTLCRHETDPRFHHPRLYQPVRWGIFAIVMLFMIWTQSTFGGQETILW